MVEVCFVESSFVMFIGILRVMSIVVLIRESMVRGVVVERMLLVLTMPVTMLWMAKFVTMLSMITVFTMIVVTIMIWLVMNVVSCWMAVWITCVIDWVVMSRRPDVIFFQSLFLLSKFLSNTWLFNLFFRFLLLLLWWCWLFRWSFCFWFRLWSWCWSRSWGWCFSWLLFSLWLWFLNWFLWWSFVRRGLVSLRSWLFEA